MPTTYRERCLRNKSCARHFDIWAVLYLHRSWWSILTFARCCLKCIKWLRSFNLFFFETTNYLVKPNMYPLTFLTIFYVLFFDRWVDVFLKFHLFWEGHKILRNQPFILVIWKKESNFAKKCFWLAEKTSTLKATDISKLNVHSSYFM